MSDRLRGASGVQWVREVRELTVYADVLFLVNFSMDVLTLAAVEAMTARRAKKGRVLGAAFVGALSATAWIAFPCAGVWLRAFAGAAVSAGMAALAFGFRGFRKLCRDTAAVWGAGSLLGGIMTALFSLGEPVFSGGDGFPAAYLLCAVFSYVWTRIGRGSRGTKTVRIRVEAAGRAAEWTALCDTGSTARDPIGGLPAILVKRRAAGVFASLLERTEAGEATGLKLRMIPVTGVGGERLLPGFIPERVTVDGAESAAAVALDGEGERYGEADALLPAALIP